MANPKTKADSRSQRTAARRPLLPVPSRKPAAPTLDGLRAQLLRRGRRALPAGRPRADRVVRSTSRSTPTRARRARRASPTSRIRSPPRRSWPTSGIDPVAVQAALLHDVPEDTEYSLADLEERFGSEVAHLVDGVTKLSKFSTHSHEEQQAENIRKMFLAMAEDIRVVLIKLADRLHNMRTLYALPSEKQQRIARQTMEIYAPLAERLGIWQMKWELEDLAFKALEPDRFRELANLLDTRRKGRESYIDRAIGELRPALEAPASRPSCPGGRSTSSASGRRCSASRPSSARSTTCTRSASSSRTLSDCYAALGIVHSIWRPIPGQFDDYIAVPKNNLYQSLHTAVIALDGKPLEIQIRTHQMHQVSEVGIAAHWRYKEGSKSDREYDAKLAWLRQLMDWQREVSDATRVRRGHQARHLPGPGLRVHPEGRHQGPAGRRDAARLRLPDPHRRRPPHDRREGQQPPGPARLPAQERRHRRDRHDQGRARPVARLAEHRPDQPRPGEDPPMVQAQGPRREHRPRP